MAPLIQLNSKCPGGLRTRFGCSGFGESLFIELRSAYLVGLFPKDGQHDSAHNSMWCSHPWSCGSPEVGDGISNHFHSLSREPSEVSSWVHFLKENKFDCSFSLWGRPFDDTLYNEVSYNNEMLYMHSINSSWELLLHPSHSIYDLAFVYKRFLRARFIIQPKTDLFTKHEWSIDIPILSFLRGQLEWKIICDFHPSEILIEATSGALKKRHFHIS